MMSKVIVYVVILAMLACTAMAQDEAAPAATTQAPKSGVDAFKPSIVAMILALSASCVTMVAKPFFN